MFVAAAVLMMLVRGEPTQSHFCPMAPSLSIDYQDTLGFILSPSRRLDASSKQVSAQTASRLVDSRHGEALVGWLFLDERGNEFISLAPNLRPALYADFGTKDVVFERSGVSAPFLQDDRFHLPDGIEVRSRSRK